MSLKLFSNNASTTLSAAITSGATTLSVTSGAGTLFPNPAAGQNFTFTLIKSGTPTTFEICLCTARSGDTFSTIVRAQEGTTALAWNAGDTVALLPTAAGLTGFTQFDDLQKQLGNYAPDTGAANAYVVTLSPALAANVVGMPIRWIAGHTNTGASTFNGLALVLPSGAALSGGEIVGGALCTSVYDGARFQLTESAYASAASVSALASGIGATFVGYVPTSFGYAPSIVPLSVFGLASAAVYAARLEGNIATSGVGTMATVITPNTGSITAIGAGIASNSGSGNQVAQDYGNVANMSGISLWNGIAQQIRYTGTFSMPAGATSISLQMSVSSGTFSVAAGMNLVLTRVA